MEQDILALKRAIFELEKNNSSNDKSKILSNIDNIISICESLKHNIEKQEKNMYKNIKCIGINTISFIYKPMLVKNYFEGDYIIRFSEQRTKDLQEAKALHAHNEFWIQHRTIKGNVFGSVPKELLNEKSIKSLLRSGWKEVEVDIIEVKGDYKSPKEIVKFCENTFRYYILLQEESTNAYLILEYKI
ncbi:hypothetical protein [Maledivibacter halophilus]|uniref:Uncharacterized protein n=1 Tax=Maledivibacter halophilus TaxID=36842 RepID=A0A1T5KJF5_9FIRM|nr:hypothetical protein [Maledivibacter halophilus]SKC63847.1 hypothetical protein SAMN02194393_01874 [Maledivibacter halophilus]